jgi:hypothetical protein
MATRRQTQQPPENTSGRGEPGFTNPERFLDRSVPAQCNTCRHNNFDGSCKAYRDGIPIVILTNQLDHRQPIQGDNGYTWKLADDAAYPEHPNDRAFMEKYIFPEVDADE